MAVALYLAILVATIFFLAFLGPGRLLHPFQKWPPGPPALPLIGSLPFIGRLPHRGLAELAQRYGGIMTVWMGSVPTIVVSSPEIMKEVLVTKGAKFASRYVTPTLSHLTEGGSDMALAPWGDNWRHLRKLATVHLLTARKVEAFKERRESLIGLMMEEMDAEVEKTNGLVALRPHLQRVTLRAILDVTFGVHHEVGGIGLDELQKTVDEMFLLAGTGSTGDYIWGGRLFQWQHWRRVKRSKIDLDRYVMAQIKDHRKRLEAHDWQKATDLPGVQLATPSLPPQPVAHSAAQLRAAIAGRDQSDQTQAGSRDQNRASESTKRQQSTVTSEGERVREEGKVLTGSKVEEGKRVVAPGACSLQKVTAEEENKQKMDEDRLDFVDVLLRLEAKGEVTEQQVRLLSENMISAGADTSSGTAEWVISMLMQHPDKQRLAAEEMERVVGFERLVTEGDLPQLPYLQAVVKEALRMHMPAPLFVPHAAVDTCTLGGYTIPAGTQVLVNGWAAGNDPKLWDKPSEFRPEQWLDKNDLEYGEQDMRMVPFGAGRRSCVGRFLGLRMAQLLTARLLQRFEWESATALPLQGDVEEEFGLTVKPKQPTVARVQRRGQRTLHVAA